MKKVLREESFTPEHAEFYCDKHPTVRCYARVETIGWYGSEFDMTKTEAHLCDECMQEVNAYLKEKFGVEPQDIEF